MSRLLEPTLTLADPYSVLQQLSPATYTANELRHYLQKIHHQLKDWFLTGADTELILQLYTQIIDEMLIHLWLQQGWQGTEPIALLAVGGYGRQALHPHSDIDITIVLDDKSSENPTYLDKIQKFMASLWDSKLKIGHSVRSLSVSLQQAEQDLTTFTSLLESRLIYGSQSIAEQLTTAMYTLCSPQHFIRAKYTEYKERYAKYAIPPYTLEPDIKHSPGGLRDIQLIEWLINFTYKTKQPEACLDKLFTATEQHEWLMCKRYLNTIRCARHMVSACAGDQLLFDYQLDIGRVFDNDTQKKSNKIVSDFMHNYFLHTRNVARLTRRGLQLLHAFTAPPSAIRLNHAYISIEEGEIQFLKSVKEVLLTEPWHLFEIFTLYSEHPEAYQLSVSAQRIIEKYRHLIPENCYAEPRYQDLFMRILRSPKVFATLELLHEYGLLAKYLVEFGPITGMMQYDLFHAYPVDRHTLLVVKNLADFMHHPNNTLFPLATEVAKQINKPEILYLAGIFHDIGKGRGGAHEDIGAEFIQNFAAAHQFSNTDIELMRWLVQDHLLLSHTAQHQDITNPAIIEEFASKIKDSTTLQYLYLLTIADIYATNQKLWTAWRSSLIDTLYQETMHIFHTASIKPKTIVAIVADKQQEALALIHSTSQKKATQDLWQQFNADYFLSRTPEELVQHAVLILSNNQYPIITITPHHSKSATEIFIYTQQHAGLFLAITSLLTKLQLSIVAADINNTAHQYNLSTYVVFQRNNQPLDNEVQITRIIERIQEQLQNLSLIQTPALKHLPTRLQALNYPPIIEFTSDNHSDSTTMSLFAPDRAGLLAHIAQVCYHQNIEIHRAQINTLGERAEDIFWLLNSSQKPLSTEEQHYLAQELKVVLTSSD